jgi:uncharacterized repeat protein (TIGR01451 family)
MTRTTRGGRRLLIATAALSVGFGAAASWGMRASAQTATPSVVQAEGDAYAVYGEASVLGNAPIHVGPVSEALAYVPPTSVQHAAASVVNCNNAVGPNCVDPLVDGINVLQSNADAGKSQLTTHCDGAPTGFGGDKIVGGNSCVTIASIAALNGGTAQAPADALFASAVTAESQMQGCDFKKAVGKVEIANLTIGGTEVIGPEAGDDLTPAPNTAITLGLVTVILNEQHYDNQGHGFTVNAIHVFSNADTIGSLAQVNLIIGHAHSEDMCDTGTVTTPPSNPGSAGQNLPTGTKADSTKHADPGEVVTYTLTITTNSCLVESVTDFLPATFTYIPGTASGDLMPTEPTVTQKQSNPAIQQLEWFTASGLSKATLTETFKVKVPDDAAPGDYVNNVEGESSPPLQNPTIACGSFVFSDTLATNGPIPANNGNNPGVIVPRNGGPAATPTPAPATATPTAAAAPLTTTAIATPNTAGSSPAGWATPLGFLAMLGGLLVLRRRTRGRQH